MRKARQSSRQRKTKQFADDLLDDELISGWCPCVLRQAHFCWTATVCQHGQHQQTFMQPDSGQCWCHASAEHKMSHPSCLMLSA